MAKDIFTTKQHRDYISLFFLGQWVCNCDNWSEIKEEEHKILGY